MTKQNNTSKLFSEVEVFGDLFFEISKYENDEKYCFSMDDTEIKISEEELRKLSNWILWCIK